MSPCQTSPTGLNASNRDGYYVFLPSEGITFPGLAPVQWCALSSVCLVRCAVTASHDTTTQWLRREGSTNHYIAGASPLELSTNLREM